MEEAIIAELVTHSANHLPRRELQPPEAILELGQAIVLEEVLPAFMHLLVESAPLASAVAVVSAL